MAQTGAEYAQTLIEWGVQQFRVEFVNELPHQVQQLIRRYQQLLSGEMIGADLWRSLKADHPVQNQLGVTRGTIEQTGLRVG